MYPYNSSQQSDRARQISNLRLACPQATPRDAAQSIFEFGLRIGRDTLIVRITLPPNFPAVAPTIRMVTENVTHPWLDGRGNVIGSNSLFAWNQSSNLGQIVSEIMHQFIAIPPKLSRGSKSTAHPPPYMQSTHQGPSESNSNESLALPPIPNDFDELKALDVEELKELQNSKAAFDKFFNNLDIVKSPSQIRDDMKASNIEQAKKNISYEDILNKLQKEVAELQEEALDRRQVFEELAKRQEKALERYDPLVLAGTLEENAEEVDMNSEDVYSSFRSGNIQVSDFLQNYLQKRKHYHTIKAKIQLLKHRT